MSGPMAMIGIAGVAGSGKDTLADLLVEHYGFVKIAFADPMRQMVAAIDPILSVTSDDEIIRYSDALEIWGYQEAKTQVPELRQFLQRLGTEAGRDGPLGKDVWVNAALATAKGKPRVVISDLRFRNEGKAIRSQAGFTIRVERPGVESPNDHISENDLADWPFTGYLRNDGTIDGLKDKLDGFLSRHCPQILRIS